jgi:hypothetical protein
MQWKITFGNFPGEQLSMYESEKEIIEENVLKEVRNKQNEAESKFGDCPDCGSPLRAEEGCFKSTNLFVVIQNVVNYGDN